MDKIYFNDDAIFTKISEILVKNGINETPEEAAFKDKSFADVFLDLTENYIKKIILEKDFILSLQKQFSISNTVAENILKDTKEKIIPFAEKNTSANDSSSFTEKMPATSIESKPAKATTLPPIKKKLIRETDMPVKKKENVQKRNGSDKYREPIE